VEAKTKTSSGVELTANSCSNHDTRKFTGSLETKYKWPDYGQHNTVVTCCVRNKTAIEQFCTALLSYLAIQELRIPNHYREVTFGDLDQIIIIYVHNIVTCISTL